MDKSDFPHIPVALLNRLDALFPEKAPNPQETYDQLMVRAGQVSVIRFLKSEHEAQNADLLDTVKVIHVQT